MVVLFNFIPVLFVALMFLIGWKFTKNTGKRIALAVITAAALGVYAQVQPSYGPKGVIVRSVLPDFEDRKIEASDRLLAPKGGDYYDQLRSDAYKEIQRKADAVRENGGEK